MTDEQDRCERAADGLCEVTEAMRQIDYNSLLEDDLATLLAYKEELTAMCLRYRSDQRASGGDGP